MTPTSMPQTQSNKNLKKFLQITTALCFLNFLILVALPLPLRAQTIPATPQTTQQRCQNFKALFSLSSGVNLSDGVPIYCSATTVITSEIQIGLAISGTIAIMFLILGGYYYMTSGGNDEQAEKGKKILINAVIGLVVIIMSTAIVTIVSGILAGH